MSGVDLLLDGYGRIRDLVHDAVEGLSEDDLAYRVDPDANSIAWLVWHLTRVQDDHIADAGRLEQVWIAEDWVRRFALPFDRHAIGYGQRSEDVAAVRASAGLLTDYHDAVHRQTMRYLGTLDDSDFDKIIDTRWDPPVSLGVRLVSVLSDDLQHAGQAAFVRGTIGRLSGSQRAR